MPLMLLDRTVPTMISPSTGRNRIMRNFTRSEFVFVLRTARVARSISGIHFAVLDFYKVEERDAQPVFGNDFV